MSKWHTPEEIGRLLTEMNDRVSAGDTVEQVCRERGVGIATYYTWRRKYGRMGAGQLVVLKEIEAENTRLQRNLEALSLRNAILQEAVDKMLNTEQKRQAARHVQQVLGVSEHQACKVLLHTRRLSHRAAFDEKLMKAVRRLSEANPQAGYRRVAGLLRDEGISVSDKQVYRLRRLVRSLHDRKRDA
jgi:putative transposase